jgi:hypothetical protein
VNGEGPHHSFTTGTVFDIHQMNAVHPLFAARRLVVSACPPTAYRRFALIGGWLYKKFLDLFFLL